MADIIKTWPANVDARTVVSIFRSRCGWANYYFTLGRGKPAQQIDRIWWTWRGRILGSFRVDRVVVNDGSLPKLCRLDGGESEWQIRPDMWVAICAEGCEPLRERMYMTGFRGWRYFDITAYRQTTESRMRL